VEDAIELYLEMKLGQPLSVENDPMVGLFSGSPDLSEQTETDRQKTGYGRVSSLNSTYKANFCPVLRSKI
jgi:hypothetical protein